jgi:hypothetical protein
MKYLQEVWSRFLATMLVGLIIGLLVGAGARESLILDRAAQTECARYNPDTGKFEWLKENG